MNPELKELLADHVVALREMSDTLNDRVVELSKSSIEAQALFKNLMDTLDTYEHPRKNPVVSAGDGVGQATENGGATVSTNGAA